jgi:predicted nuclease with TOPRIM domain
MSIGALSDNDKAKIRAMIDQGVQVLQDVKNLKEALSETVEALSEEMEIPKNVLNKAIKVASKMAENRDELTEGREELDAVEEVLLVAGRGGK